MAWGGEPDEAAIQQLVDFSGVAMDRLEAIARLKANSLDVTRALTEFFDNPGEINKYKWDDSVWSADRDGSDNTAGVQFNIQGSDVTTGHFDTTSAAPTRPPSRTNNRTPLGAPTTHADEDADLRRALAESAAESGLPPQESGVIGSDVHEKNFGPATRSEYEQDQWALVPTKAQAITQQKPVLLPSGRKRATGAPAFLRSAKDHRLAAIVTILGQIPLSRNALLSCGVAAGKYGYSNEWWEGKPIVKQGALEATAQDEWATSQVHPDFHDELHRLVAFLDSTDRAFASVDGLADTSAIDPNRGFSYGQIDCEERFFEVLKAEYEETGNPELKPLMSLAKTERATNSISEAEISSEEDSENAPAIQSADSDTGDETIFDFLTIPLQQSQSQGIATLYDALDTIFWCDAFSQEDFPTETSNTAFIDEVGEFFIIRIGGSGLCKPCDVPTTFYADRYTESRKAQAFTIQTQIHTLRASLGRMGEREREILTCSGETGCRERKWFDEKQHNARDCWAKTIEASEALIERQRKLAQLRHTQNALAQGRTPSMKNIALIYSGDSPFELSQEEAEIKDILERGIELAKKKLADIELDLEYNKERRQQFLDALDHLSMRLTVREDEAPQDFVDKYIAPSQPQYYKPEYWNPSHKYLLRGVATTNEITYVCTRREADLIEFGDQSEPKEQWWRLVYAPQEKSPVSVEKTDAESVSIAAGSESKHPILVYASEAAIGANPVQLSDALRVFSSELSKEQSQEETSPVDNGQDGECLPLTADNIKTVGAAPWASPSKRKHSEASSAATVGSMDSRGMDMTPDSVEPFADHDGLSPATWHQEFASPTPQPNKLSGLVESLEKCQAFAQPDSPVLGRRNPADHEVMDVTAHAVKSPEMQERAGGPPPFMMNRPVDTASAASSGPINLMDMEMDTDAEHDEG